MTADSVQLSSRKRGALKQMLFMSVLDELHGHFEKMGVRYMPIKGAYLLLAGLGDQTVERKMMDIDILLDEENFTKAWEYFSILENVQELFDKWSFEKPFYYYQGNVKAKVELHSMLNRPERFYLSTKELFDRGHEMRRYMVLPSSEDALVMHICHQLVHIAYRFREDVFVDISAISGAEGFSWERFEQRARESGVEKFIRFVLRLYEDRTSEILPISTRASLMEKTRLWLFKGAFGRMPVAVRRLVFEVPFVRKPIALTIQSSLESVGEFLKSGKAA